MNKKEVSNWYGYLSESKKKCGKKNLNEISNATLNKFKFQKKLEDSSKNPSSLPFEEVFGGKLRIVIPLVRESENSVDSEMLKYLGEIKTKLGWNINLQEPFGYATKVVQSTVDGKVYNNKKRVRIGPLFKQLGPEAEEFWIKNSKFYTTKENEMHFATDYSIIISRAPMDIVRMSDMDDWSSCHSEQGSYFICAVDEATHGGGIAYLVQTKKLQDIKLQDTEIFSDSNRRIPGIQPIARVRIRRIKNYKTDEEIGIPEIRTYGQKVPGFREQVNSYLRENQSSFEKEILDNKGINLNEWEIWGGSYQDNSVEDILVSFLELDETENRIYGTPRVKSGFNKNVQLEEELDRIVTQYNTSSRYTKIYADIVDDDENEIDQFNFGGSFVIEIRDKIVSMNQNWFSNRHINFIKDSFEKAALPYSILSMEEINMVEGTVVSADGNKKTTYIFNINLESMYGDHLGDFRDFVSDLREAESSYETLKLTFIRCLESLGFIEPEYDISELEDLKYFQAKENIRDITVFLKNDPKISEDIWNRDFLEDLNIPDIYTNASFPRFQNEMVYFFENFNNETLIKKINRKILKAFKNANESLVNQQSMFGEEEYSTEHGASLSDNLYFNIYLNNRGKYDGITLSLKVQMFLKENNSEFDYEILIELSKYLDKNFPIIMTLVKNLFLDEANKLREEYIEKIKNHMNPETRKTFFPHNRQQHIFYDQRNLDDIPGFRTGYYENKIWKSSGKNWERIK